MNGTAGLQRALSIKGRPFSGGRFIRRGFTGGRLGSGKFIPIGWKLIIYFIIFMLLCIFIGLYINLGLKMSSQFYKGILDEYRELEKISRNVYSLRYYTENFLADGSNRSLERYLEANAELRDEVTWLEAYLGRIRKGEKYFLMVDLRNCLNNFADLTEQAVKVKRDGKNDAVNSYNLRVLATADLDLKYLNNLMNHNTLLATRQYQLITRQTRRIEMVAFILAVVIGLLSIIFCINFSLGITEPLSQIARNAQVIANGEFEVDEIRVQTDDELKIIVQVFNKMSRSIRELFLTIQEKAKLESQLKEEQMRNLQINNLLRETELKVLQAQINPHFLYNTLNAITQIAILEDANETSELIKSVANLLRYNLRSQDQLVTVQDEVNNLKEYFHIMKARFGERVDCKLVLSGPLKEYLIPCLTLQPLVENAFIHGVGQLEGRPGKIRVFTRQRRRRLEIIIADNGLGFDPETLKSISDANAIHAGNPALEKTSGIGLANIRERFRLYYNEDDRLISIHSKPDKGTLVILRIPAPKEDHHDVHPNDRG